VSWSKITKTYALVTSRPDNGDLRIEDDGYSANGLRLSLSTDNREWAIVVDQEDLLAALTVVIEAKTADEA